MNNNDMDIADQTRIISSIIKRDEFDLSKLEKSKIHQYRIRQGFNLKPYEYRARLGIIFGDAANVIGMRQYVFGRIIAGNENYITELKLGMKSIRKNTFEKAIALLNIDRYSPEYVILLSYFVNSRVVRGNKNTPVIESKYMEEV